MIGPWFLWHSIVFYTEYLTITEIFFKFDYSNKSIKEYSKTPPRNFFFIKKKRKKMKKKIEKKRGY